MQEVERAVWDASVDRCYQSIGWVVSVHNYKGNRLRDSYNVPKGVRYDYIIEQHN